MSKSDTNFNLGEPGRTLLCPVPRGGMVSASVKAVTGTWSAGVLTVIVSNDQHGNTWAAHPTAPTITAAAPFTPAIRVSGYAYWGVRVTTANAADAFAVVHLKG